MEKKKHRLILVDDEKLILSSLKRTFRKEGYEIHFANSGAEALKTMADIGKPFSLILTDQRMPNMNGTTFLEKAKTICPNARRIMLSGYSDFDELMTAVNKGEIHRYLSKPCNDKELILAVRQEVEQYELTMENSRLLALTKKQNQQLFEVSRTLKKKVEQQTAEIREKNSSLKRGLKNSIELLLSITEMLNPDLCRYMQETATLAKKVGKKLNLDDETLEQLEIAGLTHDLGLIGVSEKAINRYLCKMSPEAFEEFSQHPMVAQSSLLCIGTLKKASEIVLQHHERIDGSGFPNGLAGDEILLEAHILGAASDYCWIMKMWPMEMQKVLAKGRQCLGINLTNVPLTSRDFVAHSIAEKMLLMGVNEKYDIDVVTALIKIVAQNSDPGYEKLSLNKIKTGMVLAQSIKHTRSRQIILSRGATLSEKSIKTINQLAQKGLISKSDFYIVKERNV